MRMAMRFVPFGSHFCGVKNPIEKIIHPRMSSDSSPTPTMKNIQFKFYHPDLNVVSDRTLRSLLKKISTLSREIQYQEVMYLINNSDLHANEKQSLRDKLNAPLNHIHAYYVDKIERGSIEIILSLSACALWLLDKTIGETIKDAWKRTDLNQSLLDYLLKGNHRQTIINRNIDRVLDAWSFDGFLIDNIEKTTPTPDELIINVNLKTEANIAAHLKENFHKVDTDFLISELKKRIDAAKQQ